MSAKIQMPKMYENQKNPDQRLAQVWMLVSVMGPISRHSMRYALQVDPFDDLDTRCLDMAIKALVRARVLTLSEGEYDFTWDEPEASFEGCMPSNELSEAFSECFHGTVVGNGQVCEACISRERSGL
jgi:hypothetical protein